MKKLLLRLLLVLVGAAGFNIPAGAQALVATKIPFDFVAAGQTFPAGEYEISRLNSWNPRILLLSSRENHVAVVLLAIEAQGTPHDKGKLAFATVGDQHFLSRIEAADYSYTLSMPSAEPLLAAIPNRGAPGSSGSN